jgi:transglutaminase-like putative cysteine protease
MLKFKSYEFYREGGVKMEVGRKPKSFFTFFLLVFLVSLLIFGCEEKAKEKAEKSEGGRSKYFSSKKVTPKRKQGKVTFDISIDSFEGAKKVRLWIPYPISNEYQTITEVKVEGNYDYSGVFTEGEWGNSILYAEWKEPKEKPQLSFSFNVERSEIIKKDFPQEEASIPPEVEKFLLSSDCVPTSGEVKDIAEEVTKGKKTILSKAEAIYDYIVENYQRDPNIKGCGAGEVSELIQKKAGKCADIHSVFAALARSVGVPFKEIFGIRMAKEGDITGAYHCRGEFYLPGYGWVPIDASDVLKKMLKENLTLDDPEVKKTRDYFFGAQTETYIDFGTGRDITLNPPQDGERLNYFMYPYAEVDGKPLDYLSQKELKYTVTFEEQ